jgi:hypothetical protein
MKRITVVLSGFVCVSVAGCAEFKSFGGPLPFSPDRPQIFVTGENKITVDQEPINIPMGDTPYVVIFELRSTRATFDKDGIRVIGLEKFLNKDRNPLPSKPDEVKAANEKIIKSAAADKLSPFPCNPVGTTSYHCTFQRKYLIPGMYAYSVKLVIDGKPYELDPRFMY